LSRGFFVADLLRDGDRLLDIGCGDGFFTNRFFAARCTHIDAIDNDAEAIRAACARHRASNITYALLDAAAQPFPNTRYDVIVWDGAIGHSLMCKLCAECDTMSA
jgi:2-polyprenyl-3-methyl-5-hydroxy-6-metoxy-1,4-benzoquinol methylase